MLDGRGQLGQHLSHHLDHRLEFFAYMDYETQHKDSISIKYFPNILTNLSLVDLRSCVGSRRHQSEEELGGGHPASADPALRLTLANPNQDPLYQGMLSTLQW